ncbi:hypothetical protein PBY51_024633 [Eleginops maclovinus]|uniref:Uncharacterized protein n=1 Tax=Eleginops maclovinus TaxID=56733 RepID=A0AAN7Y024_ELEMC|nr:hypothetical protein PBY51_024633 [Eleginops maclovinus]
MIVLTWDTKNVFLLFFFDKVSVLNILGPFSNQQTLMSAKRSTPVERPPCDNSVSKMTTQAACKPHRSSTASKEPHTPRSMSRMTSSLNHDQVPRRIGSSTQPLIGHPPRLRPLCLAGAPGSALKECLIIRSLHHKTQKPTPNRAAGQ